MAGPSRLISAAPQFLVDDVVVAAEYYRDTLGFQIGRYARGESPDELPFFVIVSRDGVQVQLSRSVRGHRQSNRASKEESTDLYVLVTDLDLLWAELKNKAEVIRPLHTMPFGVKEFVIEDCCGYAIAFAQVVPPN